MKLASVVKILWCQIQWSYDWTLAINLYTLYLDNLIEPIKMVGNKDENS